MSGVTYQLGRVFGRLPKFARWLVVLMIAAALVWLLSPSPPKPKTAEEIAAEQIAAAGAAARASAAAAAAAAKKAEEEKKDSELRIMVAGARSLKKNMRDPDSFVLETALQMSSGAVCYAYRAKNGFGGYNRAVAYYDPETQFLVDGERDPDGYNAKCGGKMGADHTKSVNFYLK